MTGPAALVRGVRALRSRATVASALMIVLGLSAEMTQDVPLAIRVVDDGNGQPTAVRVGLQDSAGRRPGTPGAIVVSDAALPIPREAIAVMWGQQDRAQGYAVQPDGAFYVDGGFTARVPPGAYRLTLSKGFEYLAQDMTLNVAPREGLSREFRVARWVDMPARGWYSADDHIHLRRSPADDPSIVRWMAAEDLHVGNLLEMGDFWATYFSQYAHGSKGRYTENGRWLSPGQEEPRTPEVGHTISLGAEAFVRARGDYYSYDRVFDRVHDLGGVTGFAHQAMSFHGYRGLVLAALRGKVDFLELAQFCVPEGPLALDHYYLLLDLGFRLTALAGSDFPWCGRGPMYGLPAPAVAQIGNARFYAYVGGPLSFEGWFDALKSGRTFVTTGPMLFLTVNGRLPGDTVDLAPGARLRVSAEALGHDEQVPLRSLEIVAHGKVIGRASGAGASRLTVEVELPADSGMWIAARAEAGPAQVAHTTPVYVTLGGGGFRNDGALSARISTAEGYLRELEAELGAPGSALDSQAWRHRQAIERQIEDARAVLRALANMRPAQ